MSADGTLYARWMNRWEESLCFRATNRMVREFEWGLEWAAGWPAAAAVRREGLAPAEWLDRVGRLSIERSEEFFGYVKPADYRLRGNVLRFTSPVHTPYPENNIVHGQWFPAKKRHKAVLVLPHWNAPHDAHNALARAFQRFGTPALRLSLPYHDFRMPAELERADYAVSANVGRTVDAMRQAVIDIRAAADWLEAQGAERIAIVGTSLGSCSAFLASAHDGRFAVNAFNHCSTYFADVVWTGLSTIHVKQGLEGAVDLETLRRLWMPISPTAYFDRFAARPKRTMFLYARYDTTFLPVLSRQTVAMAARNGLDHKVVVMPCGHYTLGESPFKYLDGYHLVSFVLRNL
ncbi:MAG: abhydrolase domain-containing 18 [Candidatus Solibacter sp.]|nr:abhydrolase domain-containing 18 [Candidatus Solibacter sp.]